MKIAFVGHAAVGKDTLSDYTALKLNIPHISCGDLVRDYVLKNNKGSLERENLINAGNELRAKFGGDYLVKVALEKNHDNVVISGIRTIDEVSTFKKNGGIVVVVTAPDRRRYELGLIRNRIDDSVTFEEWMHKQEGDLHNTKTYKQNVGAVIAHADYSIENSGTLDDLYKKCDELLAKIKSK
jgi:dephospho-CoA kinase